MQTIVIVYTLGSMECKHPDNVMLCKLVSSMYIS